MLSKADLLSLRLVCCQLSIITAPYIDEHLIREIHEGIHYHLHQAATTPLHKALLQRLLRCGALVNHRNDTGETALHVAARYGNLQAVSLLLHSGAEIDAATFHDWTPLHLACRYGHADITQFLISHGANVNKPGFQGWTALHYAEREGHADCVLVLQTAGAESPKPRKCAAKRLHGWWGVYTL